MPPLGDAAGGTRSEGPLHSAVTHPISKASGLIWNCKTVFKKESAAAALGVQCGPSAAAPCRWTRFDRCDSSFTGPLPTVGTQRPALLLDSDCASSSSCSSSSSSDGGSRPGSPSSSVELSAAANVAAAGEAERRIADGPAPVLTTATGAASLQRQLAPKLVASLQRRLDAVLAQQEEERAAAAVALQEQRAATAAQQVRAAAAEAEADRLCRLLLLNRQAAADASAEARARQAAAEAHAAELEAALAAASAAWSGAEQRAAAAAAATQRLQAQVERQQGIIASLADSRSQAFEERYELRDEVQRQQTALLSAQRAAANLKAALQQQRVMAEGAVAAATAQAQMAATSEWRTRVSELRKQLSDARRRLQSAQEREAAACRELASDRTLLQQAHEALSVDHAVLRKARDELATELAALQQRAQRTKPASADVDAASLGGADYFGWGSGGLEAGEEGWGTGGITPQSPAASPRSPGAPPPSPTTSSRC